MGCPKYHQYHPNATLDQYCAKFGYDKSKLTNAVKSTSHYKEAKQQYKGQSEDELVKKVVSKMDQKKYQGKSLTDVVYIRHNSANAKSNNDGNSKKTSASNNRGRSNAYLWENSSERASSNKVFMTNKKLDEKTSVYYGSIKRNEKFETASTAYKSEYTKLLNDLINIKNIKTNIPSYEHGNTYKMYEKVLYNFSIKYSIGFSEEEMQNLSERELKFVAEVIKMLEEIEKFEKQPKKENNYEKKLDDKEVVLLNEILQDLEVDRKHFVFEVSKTLVTFMIKQKKNRDEILLKISIFIKLLKEEPKGSILKSIGNILSPLEKKLLLST
ncbi:MAG: hypothetical protein Q8O89_05715 [Nanoarchaeota archaeon]|nr:hypothetical protein [Nanoarchaeota archaeon]